MKKINLIILAFLMTGYASSQSLGEIHGNVINQQDQLGVIYGTVMISNDVITYTELTDDNGKFKFKGLVPGEYKIRITHAEFSNYSMNGIVVTPDKITFLEDIEMGMNVLGTVTITWTPPLLKKDNPALISILPTDLKHNANAKNPAGMISQLPGITAGDNGQQLYFRGSRSTSINTYIDGVKLITSSIASIPSNAIKSINVYTGGVPASYGDITGGVVIIQTKTYMDFYQANNN